jgi:hypothetical protein
MWRLDLWGVLVGNSTLISGLWVQFIQAETATGLLGIFLFLKMKSFLDGGGTHVVPVLKLFGRHLEISRDENHVCSYSVQYISSTVYFRRTQFT